MIKLKIIIINIIKKINGIKFLRRDDYKYSFLFPLIINKLGVNITEESADIVRYCFSMFTLSFIVLICFINVFGYIASIYLISKYDIETKFPRLKRIIKYYEKSTLFFIIFEASVGLIFLLFIIIINLVLCGLIFIK